MAAPLGVQVNIWLVEVKVDPGTGEIIVARTGFTVSFPATYVNTYLLPGLVAPEQVVGYVPALLVTV